MGSDGEEEKDAPRMKKVPRWNRFTFRYHNATNVRNKERGRERQSEKNQQDTI